MLVAVDAGFLYEAVALAVVEFRADFSFRDSRRYDRVHHLDCADMHGAQNTARTDDEMG